MGKIVVLGSANAVPNAEHENTHLLAVGGERSVLIDCSSNPIQHLRRAGVAFEQLTDLILTHFHPDHVSGVPLLLMDLWLMGRTTPLEIYGLAYTLDRTQAMMELFGWQNWPDFYPVHFHRVDERELALVLETDELRILASPVKHLIPTIGLRIEFIKVDKVVTYSCDTEPCPQVVRLAHNANVLIHEATGEQVGHSSPAQAAGIAKQAGAQALYLIHYSPEADGEDLVRQARDGFMGPIRLAHDFMVLEYN